MRQNIRGELTKAQTGDRRGSAAGAVVQPEITLLKGIVKYITVRFYFFRRFEINISGSILRRAHRRQRHALPTTRLSGRISQQH